MTFFRKKSKSDFAPDQVAENTQFNLYFAESTICGKWGLVSKATLQFKWYVTALRAYFSFFSLSQVEFVAKYLEFVWVEVGQAQTFWYVSVCMRTPPFVYVFRALKTSIHLN